MHSKAFPLFALINSDAVHSFINFLISLHRIPIKHQITSFQYLKVQHLCHDPQMLPTTTTLPSCVSKSICIPSYYFVNMLWICVLTVPTGEWSEVLRSAHVHTASDQCLWGQRLLGYGHVLWGRWWGHWRLHAGEPPQPIRRGDGQGKHRATENSVAITVGLRTHVQIDTTRANGENIFIN